MLVAWDDTDNPDGGCTTALLIPILAATGLAPRAVPRLVRLNPNVAWKTRGNGAVCVELVEPTGPHVQIGEWQGNEIHAYPDGAPVAASREWLEKIHDLIAKLAQPDAMPGLALFDDAPNQGAYWAAVQTFVEPGTFATEFSKAAGDKRALTGAIAAAAWPGPPSSYELIAYRSALNIGKPRELDPEPFARLDAVGASFHSYDAEEDKAACIPNTPCPVLVGLRGQSMEALMAAGRRALLEGAKEPIDAWMMWATNQASGDHVVAAKLLAHAPPQSTIRITGTVGAPAWIKGGHVVAKFTDDNGKHSEIVAFEPSKDFRHHVANLMAGDKVEVTGSFKDGIQLESLRLLEAVPKKSAPMCCIRMKSKGRNAGYKCPKCGKKGKAVVEPRDVGAWEVPVMARRHLHRPLAWEQSPTPPGQ